MRFDGTIGPIGNLADTEVMLSDLAHSLHDRTLPIIRCAKTKCHCGLCAPKAATDIEYHATFEKYTQGYY